MNCIFCKIINGEVPAYKLWENEQFLALLDINPIKPGHLVVMPKAHYSDIYEMPEDLYSELFSAIKKIAPLLKQEIGSKRVGLSSKASASTMSIFISCRSTRAMS